MKVYPCNTPTPTKVEPTILSFSDILKREGVYKPVHSIYRDDRLLVLRDDFNIATATYTRLQAQGGFKPYTLEEYVQVSEVDKS
jgi:hypothetical protein